MAGRLVARPVPLTEAARTALQPALERGGQHNWAEVEGWIAVGDLTPERLNEMLGEVGLGLDGVGKSEVS